MGSKAGLVTRTLGMAIAVLGVSTLAHSSEP